MRQFEGQSLQNKKHSEEEFKENEEKFGSSSGTSSGES
jgi:hypothetical protein